jgi:carbon starvation protein
MINAFILTSLDTLARLGRYIVQETFGDKFGGFFKNKHTATLVGLIFAYIIAATGSYSVIGLFCGTSNQLIAAIALFIVTIYFVGFKAPKWYTVFPAIFMLLVTEIAFIYQIFYIYIPKQNWILAVSVLSVYSWTCIELNVFKKYFY